MNRDLASGAPGRELRDWLEKESSQLQIKDAFVVPHWFSEQRAWLEDPANSNSAVCNYVLLLHLQGVLDKDALQRTLEEIVRRHEVLRSRFRTRQDELIQIVVEPETLDLREIDLSGEPAALRDARARELVSKEAQVSLDLALGPLLRSRLVRLGAEEHWLQLTTHDIVFDDWSSGILFRELSECYQAFAAGLPSPLPDLPLSYGDYVRWQEKRLQGIEWRSKLTYWKQQLSSRTGFYHLSADFPRPAKPTYRTAREQIVLSADLASALKELAREERVSLFMVLLAGLQCLLHRFSGAGDIGVASCAANRPLVEVEKIIGRFGNEIFLRTSLLGNPTYRELLTRVRQTALNAYSDQELPFGRLVQGASEGVPRGTSRPPFQLMFFSENAHPETMGAPGLIMSRLPWRMEAAKYDLNVCLRAEPAQQITLDYATDHFRPATAAQFLEDYRDILEKMTQHPEARVGSLSTATESEPLEVQIEPAPAVATPDDFELRLTAIWEAAFGIRPIGLEQDFFELGGDSLLAARLFVEIEKTFKVPLPLAALLHAPTIRQLAAAMRSRQTQPLGSSLVAIQSTGTKPPLFCVHGHVGEVFFCRNLAHCLGADQPVYGLRSQGLGGEKPYDSVEAMAAHYLREIRTVQPTGPYYLGGFCFGGMIAYEMARRLEMEGDEVGLLALFNTPPPGALQNWPLNRVYLTRRIAHELHKLRSLPGEEKLTFLQEKATGLTSLLLGSLKGALSRFPLVSSDGGGRLLSVADLNVLAAKAYQPEPYPGRITLFLTHEIGSIYGMDPRQRWGELAAGGIQAHPVAGDNRSLFDGNLIEPLAEELRACLARASDTRTIACTE